MSNREHGGLIARTLQLLVARVQLDDAERVDIAGSHQAWKQKAYGASEYVRYGKTAQGGDQLWMSTRNVPANAPAPDVPTNPQNWRKL